MIDESPAASAGGSFQSFFRGSWLDSCTAVFLNSLDIIFHWN